MISNLNEVQPEPDNSAELDVLSEKSTAVVVAKVAVIDSEEKFDKKSTEKFAKNSFEKSAKNSTEKSAKNSTEKSAKNSTEKSAKNTTEKSAKNTTEKSAKNSTEKSANNSTEKFDCQSTKPESASAVKIAESFTTAARPAISPADSSSKSSKLNFFSASILDSETVVKAKIICAISDKICDSLDSSSLWLSVGILDSDGFPIPRLSALVYFAGLLVLNLHPNGPAQVEEILSRTQMLINSVEVETLAILKHAKKLGSAIRSYAQPIVKELSLLPSPSYDGGPTFSTTTATVTSTVTPDTFEQHIFDRQDDDAAADWLELTNSDDDADAQNVQLYAAGIVGLGPGDKLLAKTLELDVGTLLLSLVLEEILKLVQSAKENLQKIELKVGPKKWREASDDLVCHLKFIRTTPPTPTVTPTSIAAGNCCPGPLDAAAVVETLTQLKSKLTVSLAEKLAIVESVSFWILKGMECIRSKAGGKWAAPGRKLGVPPEVSRHLYGRGSTSVITIVRQCFGFRRRRLGPGPEPEVNFDQMFRQLRDSIGPNFLLEIPISPDTKRILFAKLPDGRGAGGYFSLESLVGDVSRVEEVTDLGTKSSQHLEPPLDGADSEDLEPRPSPSLAEKLAKTEPEPEVVPALSSPESKSSVANNEHDPEPVLDHDEYEYETKTSGVGKPEPEAVLGRTATAATNDAVNADPVPEVNSEPDGDDSGSTSASVRAKNCKPSKKLSFYWGRHLIEKIPKDDD